MSSKTEFTVARHHQPAEAQTFKCAQCDRSYNHQRNLIRHQHQDHGSQPKHCDPVLAALTENKSTVNKNSGESVARAQNLQCHQQEPDTGLLSVSHETPKALANTRNQISMKGTGELSFQCAECGKSTSSTSCLKRHMLTHSGNRPYQCSFCTRSFLQKGNLKSHQLVHTGESAHQCTQCGVYFKYAGNLNHHRKYSCKGICRGGRTTGESFNDRVRSDVLKFSCEVCDKSFSTSGNFKRHLLTHSGTPVQPCPDCGKSLRDSGSLNRHMLIHTVERPFRCNICDKCFTQRSSLKEHLLLHSGKRPYQCQLCGKSFAQKTNLTQHAAVHSDRRPHQCTDCHTFFKHVFTLRDHRAYSCKGEAALEGRASNHQGSAQARRFVCEDCNKAFSTKYNLKQHQMIHTGERPYGCAECGKSFRLKPDLKRHELTHTGELVCTLSGECRFACSECSRSFGDQYQLEEHQREHGYVKRPYMCPHCTEAFGTIECCRMHLLLHDGEEPQQCVISTIPLTSEQCDEQPRDQREYPSDHSPVQATALGEKKSSDESVDKQGNRKRLVQCPECGESVRDGKNLRRHLLTHSGERPYQCQQCNKSCTHVSHLKKHMLIHTGERPYKCGQCGKSFLDKSNFKRHALVHTSKRPHQCAECDMAFKYAGNLKEHEKYACRGKAVAQGRNLLDSEHQHMRVPAAKYICENCSKPFGNKGNLKRHMAIHREAEIHKCPECGKGFNSRDTLSKHKRKHTGERPYMCEKCGKAFAHRQDFRRHQQTHERDFVCSVCNMSFSRRCQLTKHRLKHTVSEGPYMCDQCPGAFRTVDHFKQHLSSHGDAQPKQCANYTLPFVSQHGESLMFESSHVPVMGNACNASWLSSPDNLDHSSQPERCDLVQTAALAENKSSDESVASMKNLCHQQEPDTVSLSVSQHKPEVLAHEQVHELSAVHDSQAVLGSKEQSVQCPECGKSLRNDDCFVRHLLTHTGERPYQCQQCNNSFPAKSSLKRHLLTHTGQRPYQCRQCGKSFLQKSNLKQHAIVHTDERTNHCANCGMSFKYSNSLNEHRKYACRRETCTNGGGVSLDKQIWTRVGLRKFVCNDCNKSFSTCSNLKQHMLTHSGALVRNCSECGKTLSDERGLKRHMLTHAAKRPHQCGQCDRSFAREFNLTQHALMHTDGRP